MIKHQLSAQVWFSQADDRWHARLAVQEFRGKEQYGGAVVEDLKGRKGQSHRSFLAKVRKAALQHIRTCWT